MTETAGASGGVPDATVETGPPVSAERQLELAREDADVAADRVDRMQTKVDKAQQHLADAKQALADAKRDAKAAAGRVRELEKGGDD